MQVNKSGNGGSAPPVDLPIHLLLLHSSSQLDVICISEENSRSPGFCRQQVADFNPTRSRVSKCCEGKISHHLNVHGWIGSNVTFPFTARDAGLSELVDGLIRGCRQTIGRLDTTEKLQREEMVIMMKRESDLLLLLAGGGYSSFAHFTYLRSVHRCGLSFFTMSLI